MFDFLADAVDLSTPPITISCTAVLMSESRREPLRFHTFLSIPINHIFLGKREGVNSILIRTLICVLQQQILSGREVSDDITRIISAVGSDSPDRLDLETITVATTRAPVFGDYMQDPIYGYRSLCTLLSVSVDTEFTSIAFEPDSELLAVCSDDDDPITKNFARMWAPCGLKLKTHFIVILTHTPAPSLDGSPFLFRDIGTSPPPISGPSSVVQPTPLVYLSVLIGSAGCRMLALTFLDRTPLHRELVLVTVHCPTAQCQSLLKFHRCHRQIYLSLDLTQLSRQYVIIMGSPMRISVQPSSWRPNDHRLT
jgi:hypothetical protein